MNSQANGRQTRQDKDTNDTPSQVFPILQVILWLFIQMPTGDSMKAFIDEYRRFRHLVREEIGDIEEPDIMMLFSIYVERRPIQNPFAGLETFFKGYTDIFQPNNPNNDPDDESNDDDPFANTSGNA